MGEVHIVETQDDASALAGHLSRAMAAQPGEGQAALVTDGEYERTHQARWDLTLAVLRKRVAERLVVLDVGGKSKFTDMMRGAGYLVGCTDETDVTDQAWVPPQKHDEYDAVTCCEVLEHLRDTPDSPRHMYTGSGVDACLRGCYAALKPGGLLLVTTPNANSLACLHHVLVGLHPFMYAPHLREMTADELAHRVASAGFVNESLTSHDVWGMHGISNGDWLSLKRVAKQYRGGRDVQRGAMLMLIARKGEL